MGQNIAMLTRASQLARLGARTACVSSRTPALSASHAVRSRGFADGAGVGGAVFGDPRNEDILIYLNTAETGEAKFVPRKEAVVSVFDSGFILGDGLWEGLRLYNGTFFSMEAHMKRLYQSCKFMDIDIGMSPEALCADLDKLNSHSKINCITACISAQKAGFDEALMLDPHGQVATCNSVHFFIVRNGEVWTSGGNYCIPGITRNNILQLCHENGIPAYEKDFSLFDVYGADEVFCTGTFGGVTPVSEVDGRRIGENLADSWDQVQGDGVEFPGPMVQRLRGLYNNMVIKECGGL